MSQEPPVTAPPRSQAVDPATPPARLGQLAAAASELARLVAGNPSTTPGMLVRLARHADREVREAVCVHPATPPRIVFRLALEMPEVFAHAALARTFFREGRGGAPRTGVVVRLLAREHLPLAWIEALLAHPHPRARVALASRPALARHALARLAEDPSPHVRCVVAGRGELDGRQIDALTRDPDARVRARIAAHAGLTAAHVAALAADPDEFVRAAAAARPDLPPALAEALFGDPSLWVRSALARNPVCPESLVLAFAGAANVWLDDAVLANPSAPPAALILVGPRIAARPWYVWTSRMLVQHPRATAEVVAAALRGATEDARRQMIFDAPRLELAMMLELADDPSPRVAFSLGYRKDAPVEVLARLFARPEDLPRGVAACNAAAPAWLLERAAVDAKPWVRSCVAENPSAPVALVERLSRDAVASVRLAVAKHTRDPELLARMADDADVQVLNAVSYNPATPRAVAERLHGSPTVRAYRSYG